MRTSLSSVVATTAVVAVSSFASSAAANECKLQPTAQPVRVCDKCYCGSTTSDQRRQPSKSSATAAGNNRSRAATPTHSLSTAVLAYRTPPLHSLACPAPAHSACPRPPPLLCPHPATRINTRSRTAAEQYWDAHVPHRRRRAHQTAPRRSHTAGRSNRAVGRDE